MHGALLCIAVLTSLAQGGQELSPPPLPPVVEDPPLPPEPPPLVVPPPAPTPPPSPPVRAEPRPEPRRRRSFLEFRGGQERFFLAAEVLAGGVAGGIIGARLSGNDLGYTLLGVAIGAPLLSLTTSGYLYATPDNVFGVSLLGAGAGALGGIGLAVRGRWDVGTAILALVAAEHLGLLAVLLSTLAVDDISDDDTALVRMLVVNVSAGAVIALWLLHSLGRPVDATTLFFAPAAGMALGGGLAFLLDVPAHRSDFVAGVPLLTAMFAGGMVYFITSDGFRRSAMQAGPAPAIVAASAFAGMFLLGMAVDTRSRKERESGVQAFWAPLLQPSGARGEEVAVGSAVAVRF